MWWFCKPTFWHRRFEISSNRIICHGSSSNSSEINNYEQISVKLAMWCEKFRQIDFSGVDIFLEYLYNWNFVKLCNENFVKFWFGFGPRYLEIEWDFPAHHVRILWFLRGFSLDFPGKVSSSKSSSSISSTNPDKSWESCGSGLIWSDQFHWLDLFDFSRQFFVDETFGNFNKFQVIVFVAVVAPPSLISGSPSCSNAGCCHGMNLLWRSNKQAVWMDCLCINQVYFRLVN